MSTGVAEVGTLRLLGGRLCLDFTITRWARVIATTGGSTLGATATW
jgi:hypothetical protein